MTKKSLINCSFPHFHFPLLKTSVLIFALSLLTSCHHREIAYISDAQRDSIETILSIYDAMLIPGDQLYISVSSLTPESVIPFNQETHKLYLESNSLQVVDTSVMSIKSQAKYGITNATRYVTSDVSGYFVSDKGEIDFPIIGKIHVEGITIDSLNHFIENYLIDNGLVKDPVVTSQLMNFRVTVVGEVRQPRQIHVRGTRLTILEALAICGDLTDYGQRDNLVVVRSDNGKRTVAEIDLTKKELLDSPYYYLHNNDIVYVEPNKRKKKDSDRDIYIPQYISMGVSGLSIINNISRIMTRLKYY